MPRYYCKTASINDVWMMLDWARSEGWNPGLDDALPFLVTDPTGFFVGMLDEKPIATISAIRYPNNIGFIGFYIVAPEYRGQGYGIKLWQHGMNYLSGYNIGLDAVVATQSVYEKSGFIKAYENLRFSGIVSTRTNKALIDIKTIPLISLLNYDQALFPAPRSAFLAAWFAMPHHKGLAFVENDKIKGYGVIRKCDRGYKIGPLFANSYEISETLFLGLCEYAQDETVFLDVPAINKNALKLAAQFNLKSVFTTARMFTKNPYEIDLQRIYGITSFELG